MSQRWSTCRHHYQGLSWIILTILTYLTFLKPLPSPPQVLLAAETSDDCIITVVTLDGRLSLPRYCVVQTSGKHANAWINSEAAYIAGGQQHLKLLYYNDTSVRSPLFGKTLGHYNLVFALMYQKFKNTSHIGRRPINLIKHIRMPLPAFLRYGEIFCCPEHL